MAVVLKFQSTGSIPGNGDPVHMQGPSLTIGRGPENDLVLPDPERVMSKRHCAIEDHNGNVVVVDMSTNGTFLNYGKLALGPTPTPLNDGDILCIGPYELLVSIPAAGQADVLAAPASEAPVSHGFADRAPSTSELLDAPGDGGDFLDDLLGGREGPVGPSGVERDAPGDDGLLPPLAGEDDFLAPTPEPEQGASMGMHSASGSDHFAPPTVATGAQAIPDDWDLDLGGGSAPTPAAPAPAAPAQKAGTPDDPFAQTASQSASQSSGGSAFIPDDFDLGGETAPPAPGPDMPALQPSEADPPLAEPLRDTTGSPDAPLHAPLDAGHPAAPAPTPVAPAPAAPAREEAPVIAAPGTSGASDDAARVFLKALGAENLNVADQDLVPTMSRLGHILRVMITGLREVLMTRSSIKSEFRVKQTVLKAGDNNALKFSISNEQAIEAMVLPKVKGYLDAVDATEESMRDIKAHEVAMMTGMQAAIQGVLAKLDPETLEARIDQSGGRSMLKSRNTRYWESYKSMYSDISDQAESDFYELFAKEFANAYQDQLDKLK